MAYLKRWDDLFNSLDTNKSGDLTTEDAKIGLANFIKKSGVKEGTPQYKLAADAYEAFYRDLIKEMDTDNDQKVSKAEYDQTVKKIISGGKDKIPQWWKSAVATLFQSVDKNSNGELSFEEFKEYAKNTSPSSSEAEVQSAFEWAKQVTGKKIIDGEAFMDLVWIWGSSPDAHRELDIIFSYWK